MEDKLHKPARLSSVIRSMSSASDEGINADMKTDSYQVINESG